MSTDILKFDRNEQDLQTKALKLYLLIALPLTALTFVAWYVVYLAAKKENCFSRRREENDRYPSSEHV
jgi:hypothetical protein